MKYYIKTNLYSQHYINSHDDHPQQHSRAYEHDFTKHRFTIGELYNYITLVYTRCKYCNFNGQPQVFIFISNLYGGYYIKYYGNAMLFASLN